MNNQKLISTNHDALDVTRYHACVDAIIVAAAPSASPPSVVSTNFLFATN